MRFVKTICQRCYAENELTWDEIRWCQGFIMCPCEFERIPVQKSSVPCHCFGYFSKSNRACKQCALTTECEKESRNKVYSLEQDDIPNGCPYRLEHIMK